jgi:Zn-finger nucleic acid-binding protein
MIETRIPCPVCLGVKMVKKSPIQRRRLTLDLCPRCGGIWFDPGEAQQLRGGKPFPMPGHFRPPTEVARCHGCSAIIDRSAERCSACGAGNEIDCPQCSKPMRRGEHDGILLDVCQSCRGIWFDGHEVAAVWTIALAAAAQGHTLQMGASPTTSDLSISALDALTYSPDLGAVIVEGSMHAVAATPELLSGLPEAGGVVAEAAGAVFEVLVQVIGVILEGLSG